MPAFAITVTTPNPQLRPDRTGEVSFTVTNLSSGKIRGEAKIKPDDPAQAAWLQVGDAERDFDVDGVQQFVVRITVPAGAPGGTCKFQLNMKGTSKTSGEEQFVGGPSVAVTVPPPVEKNGKPFPWWIVAVAAAVVLIVGGVITWIILPDGQPEREMVNVPNVVGTTADKAQETIEALNLTVGVQYATEVKQGQQTPGVVVSQSPKEGQRVEVGTTVDLVVPSIQLIEVPDLQFKPIDVARARLKEVGLNPSEKDPKVCPNLAKNQVCDQRPAAGNKMPPGANVDLWIAADATKVPSVLGLSQRDAQNTLQGAGLVMSLLCGHAGLVTFQTPRADKQVARGSGVQLYLGNFSPLGGHCQPQRNRR